MCQALCSCWSKCKTKQSLWGLWSMWWGPSSIHRSQGRWPEQVLFDLSFQKVNLWRKETRRVLAMEVDLILQFQTTPDKLRTQALAKLPLRHLMPDLHGAFGVSSVVPYFLSIYSGSVLYEHYHMHFLQHPWQSRPYYSDHFIKKDARGWTTSPRPTSKWETAPECEPRSIRWFCSFYSSTHLVPAQTRNLFLFSFAVWCFIVL
jgi:hypothetical protein